MAKQREVFAAGCAALETALTEEWPDKQRLAYEKECLGFYVSGHPLDRYAHDIKRLGCTSIGDLRERVAKTGGGRMAFIQLEDLTGRVELLVFTKAYPLFEPYLTADEPLLIHARVSREGDEDARTLKLRADNVSTLRAARAERTSRARLTLPADEIGPPHLGHLAYLLGGGAGERCAPSVGG